MRRVHRLESPRSNLVEGIILLRRYYRYCYTSSLYRYIWLYLYLYQGFSNYGISINTLQYWILRIICAVISYTWKKKNLLSCTAHSWKTGLHPGPILKLSKNRYNWVYRGREWKWGRTKRKWQEEGHWWDQVKLADIAAEGNYIEPSHGATRRE